MPREDDAPMDTGPTFDALIDTIRARDGTPGPDPRFTRALEQRLTARHPDTRSTPMQTHATVLDRPSPWTAPRLAGGARWAALAATVALLLATVGGGYLTGIRLPGRGGPATNIAAPMTGTPESTTVAPPVGSPVAVARSTSADCTREKSYWSTPLGNLLLQSPQLFSKEALGGIDQMQLQHWSFGPGITRTFGPAEMEGIHGLVMDTVTSGVYRGTFQETVVASTAYDGFQGQISTELRSTVNTVELGVGESVLFEAGTEHEIENLASGRGLSVERLILYYGDGADLLPELRDPADRPSEQIRNADSNEDLAVSVRLDGTGTLALGEVPLGWRNIVIYTEFVASNPDEPLTVLVPPTCESQPAVQVRNVDEMLQDNGQYVGYLVWFWEGGRG